MTDLAGFSKAFMRQIMTAFRPPSQAADAKLTIEIYHDHLGSFPVDVLAAAAKHITATRQDPFMPTVAECIEACEREQCTREGKPYVGAADKQRSLDEAKRKVMAIVGGRA